MLTFPTSNRVACYLITHHLSYMRCRLLLSDQPRLAVADTKTRTMPYSGSRPSIKPDLHPTLSISLSRVPLRCGQPATSPAANPRFDPSSTIHRYIISREEKTNVAVGIRYRRVSRSIGFMMQQCKKSTAAWASWSDSCGATKIIFRVVTTFRGLNDLLRVIVFANSSRSQTFNV